MNVWPPALPTGAVLQDVTRGIGDSRIRAQMDAGYKTRSRLSYVPEPVTVSIVMTVAQRATLEAFVRNDLKRGTLPFRFPAQDGVRGQMKGEWIVMLGQTMPSWKWHSEDNWSVSLDLVRLPQ
jgi:hypothetical protein